MLVIQFASLAVSPSIKLENYMKSFSYDGLPGEFLGGMIRIGSTIKRTVKYSSDVVIEEPIIIMNSTL